jgi:type VI secretion system protein ImpE
MDIKQLIRNAELTKARKKLIQRVKKAPGDTAHRTHLFQVLLFLGEWDKALVHLNALAKDDKTSHMAHEVYTGLIRAEQERTEVAELRKEPSFLPGRPGYADLYFQAVEAATQEENEIAATLFDQIGTATPLISGTVNQEPFTGFSDTDTLLNGFLEAMEYDRYLWIPFEAIREITVQSPQTLMDLIWTKGSVTTWEGLTMACFFPVLYPLSHCHTDDRVKMGRVTDWQILAGPYVRAWGQHVFRIGERDVSLLEIETVMFNRPVTKESRSTL